MTTRFAADDRIVRIYRDDGKPDSAIIAEASNAEWAQRIARALNSFLK